LPLRRRTKLSILKKEFKLKNMSTKNKKQNPSENNLTVSGTGKNLDSVIRDCEVDLDAWDIDHYTIDQNSRGYNYTLYLKKKKPLLQDLVEIKRELSGLVKIPSKIEYKRRDNGSLLEFANFDLHWGKLAWAKESGADYDMREATIALNKAVDYTIDMASKFNICKIVFPFGQDFFQIDNEAGTTTAGTPQDVDSRFKKIIKEGRKLVISTIEKLRKLAPVDVVVVPGNHGRMAEFQLGDLLEVKYENDKHVNVNNEPTDRKYYTFGNSFIMYTHGDQEKINDLPLIMATSRPKEWGEAKHRFIKLGHRHMEQMKEFCGCKVEWLPSLSASDAWHSRKGYVNNVRGVSSAVYDRNMGIISKIYFNL
jgi:hypothetical protein